MLDALHWILFFNDHILHLPCAQIGACKDRLLEQGVSRQFLPEDETEEQNKLLELDLAGKQKAQFDQFNKETQQAERISTTIASVNMELEVNTIEASDAVTEFSYIDKKKFGPYLELGSEKER